ncbi:MAG: glycosyltransferase family 4 protein [Nonlabens sp.]
MKILLLHQYFLEKEDGGGSRFNQMTQEWGKQGVDITVIAGMVHYNAGIKRDRYKGLFTHFDKSFYHRVDVWRSHVSELYNTNFLGRLWAYFSFVFSSLYVGLWKLKSPPDVIVVTSPPLFIGITAYVLSMVKRVPFVFEVRDLWPESAVDTGVLKNKLIIKLAYKFEAFMYSKAAMVSVLTPAFKEKLISKGVPANKIVFLPNAADFTLANKVQQEFDPLDFRRKLGLVDKFVLTYVGAHGVANHLEQLLDVADQLKDTNVVFQLIGSGMSKPKLIATASARELDNVIFRESVAKSEVFKYILASDMGISVLKKVDTFKTIYSNKTFDYMSCRIPVLMAIDGVSRQLVEDANCGVYVEPENTMAMVDAIVSLKQNDRLLQTMGQTGYEFAIANFDRTVIAGEYLSVLKNVVAGV